MKNLFMAFMLMTCHCVFGQLSDAYVLNLMNTGHIPGVSSVVIKNGQWVFDRSWGKADIANNRNVDRQTVFMMASISKTIVATAMMQLWERGLFGLDEDINHYLPFSVTNPYYPSDVITFRMLATHTSSIRDDLDVLGGLYVLGDSPISLDSFLRNYLLPGGTYYNASKVFYGNHTGAARRYSNVGISLAAYLVQVITGDDFSHYCDTAIFARLCMDNTSFKLAGIADTNRIARPYYYDDDNNVLEDIGLYGYPDYPDGQLRTTITSLARFMTMYMQYGIYNGTRILDSTTVLMMMKDQYAHVQGQGIVFGRFIFSNGDTLWGHTGNDIGAKTIMLFSYKTHTGEIVFANSEDELKRLEPIYDTIYRYGATIIPAVTDTFPACTFTTDIVPVTHRGDPGSIIFPNPANEQFSIEVPVGSGQMEVAMFSLVGVKTFSGKIMGNRETVNTSEFPAGVYMICLYLDGAIVEKKKVLIVH